ncbi:MAG: nuclear transport factor 2 family protein [Acidimicrobiales bacterium]
MTDSDDEKAIRAVIDRMTEALQAADAEKLNSLLSDRPGSAFIGTDPAEWWSREELVADIKAAMAAGGSPVRAEHDEVQVHVLGDVAWAEGTGKFTNGTAERAIRTTGVFVREGDQWRTVQSHASIGVPNEAMFNT